MLGDVYKRQLAEHSLRGRPESAANAGAQAQVPVGRHRPEPLGLGACGAAVVCAAAHFAWRGADDRSAARAEAERLWPVSADRGLRLRPGVRGGLSTPAKAVLRKLMRWYVEPLAYDQRSFNAAALRLIDDLEARVAALEAELKQRA